MVGSRDRYVDLELHFEIARHLTLARYRAAYVVVALCEIPAHWILVWGRRQPSCNLRELWGSGDVGNLIGFETLSLFWIDVVCICSTGYALTASIAHESTPRFSP
jgi:hypothetical protein